MTESLRLGWEEWVALPDLGLPALKAKVDTGARTSALHAYEIEPFGTPDHPRVRFLMHPVPTRPDITIACSADVVDRREVTSSNGESELRYVIASTLQVGARSWPVELTLTDRGAMSYRMLLGRQAIPEDAVVAPQDSFCQPKLSDAVYTTGLPPAPAKDRALRIAVLSRQPRAYATRRLVEEGEARGHVIEVIDTQRCYMTLNALAPDIHYDGKRLPRYDAVIPRIGTSITPYGTAIVRQFETIGTYALNPSAGITASRDKLHAHQVLARQKIGMPTTAFAASPKDTDNLMKIVGETPLIVKLLQSTQGKSVVLTETRQAAESVISAFRGLKANFLVQHYISEAEGESLRCIVLDGRIAAAVKRSGPQDDVDPKSRGTSAKVKLTKAERDTAVKATKAFGLGLASVDLLRADSGPKVLEVNSAPRLEAAEQASGKNICAALYEMIEKRIRTAPPRRIARKRAAPRP